MDFPKTVPALLTPCSAPGVIDYDSLKRLCRHLCAEGMDGVFAVSSTGGMPLLDRPQRRRVLETARDSIPAGTMLFAGISGTGIGQVLENARDAADIGADYAIVMPPFFLKLSSPQLLDYAFALAGKSPLPLIFYHHLRMPTPIEPETAQHLSKHPNIVGMKETSGCPKRLQALAKCFSEAEFEVYQGSESLVLQALRECGGGCITALANLAPGLHRDLYEAHAEGRKEDADNLQAQLIGLWEIFKRPSVATSFAHFLQTMLIPLWREGIIDTPHTLFPGYEPEPGFVKEMLAFHRNWSARCEGMTAGVTQGADG